MNRQEMFKKELNDLFLKYNANIRLQTQNPGAWPEFQHEQMIVEFEWVEGELHDTDIVLGSYFDGGKE